MRSQTEQLRRVIAEQAASWLVAQSEAPLNAADTREFMQWLRTSPLHVEEYLVASRLAGKLSEAARQDRSTWQALASGDSRVVAFPSGSGGAVMARLARSSMVDRLRGLTAVARRRLPVGWVTAFAGLAAATLVVLATPWSLAGETLMTRRGEIRTVALPDKTLVTLDSDSSIFVRFDRHVHHVELKRGQAYFDIRSHAGPPFTVSAGAASIRDIGTRFNVRRSAGNTVVTVSTGLVEVSQSSTGPAPASQQASQVTRVGGGEQATVADTGRVTSLRATDVTQAIAWTQGKIDFRNRSIAAVVNELNQYNATQITIASDAIRDTAVSGVIGVKDADAFVAFLGSLPGVHVERRGSTALVTRNGDDVQRGGSGR